MAVAVAAETVLTKPIEVQPHEVAGKAAMVASRGFDVSRGRNGNPTETLSAGEFGGLGDDWADELRSQTRAHLLARIRESRVPPPAQIPGPSGAEVGDETETDARADGPPASPAFALGGAEAGPIAARVPDPPADGLSGSLDSTPSVPALATPTAAAAQTTAAGSAAATRDAPQARGAGMSAMLRTMLAVKQSDRGTDDATARGRSNGAGDGSGVTDADGGDVDGASGRAESVLGSTRGPSAARSHGGGQGGHVARDPSLRGGRRPQRPRLISAEGWESSAVSLQAAAATATAASASPPTTRSTAAAESGVMAAARQQLAPGHRDGVPIRARPSTTPPAAWRWPGSAADVTAAADWEPPASAGSGGGLSAPSSGGSVERARGHGLASCVSGGAEQDDGGPRWVSEAGSDAGPRRCQSLGLGDAAARRGGALVEAQTAACASVATRVDVDTGAGPGSASPLLSVPNSLDDYSVLAGAGCHPLARVGADSDWAGGRKELARQLGLDLVSLSSAELDVEELLLREEGQRSAPAVSGAGTGAGARRTTSAGVAGFAVGQDESAGGGEGAEAAGGAVLRGTSRTALRFTAAVVTPQIAVAAPAPAVASSTATTLAMPGMGARRRSVCSDGAEPAVANGASSDVRGHDVGRTASSSADDASSLAFTFQPRVSSLPTFDDPGQVDARGLGGGSGGNERQRVWELGSTDDASTMSSASDYRYDQ